VQVIRLGNAYEVLLRQTPPFGDPGIGAECFLQIYTSGTTGFPKGVELTHRNLEAHTEALGTRIGFTHESVNMAPMPLYHVGGLAWALISVYRGTPLVLARDVVPAELVDLIEHFRVTHAFVVPRVLAGMLEVPRLGHRDLSSLRALTYGAAPMPLPLLRRALEGVRGPRAVPPSCDDLLNYCRTRLASYKLPRSLVFVSELPRNGAGKVLKQTLRQHRGRE
jgi:acyl-CoA synthetase (AMP-forming)/AMP-acid ligase II